MYITRAGRGIMVVSWPLVYYCGYVFILATILGPTQQTRDVDPILLVSVVEVGPTF